ncbi:MAG: DUF6788 family protein, partial [Acidimicrobiales bacterium]
MTSRLERPKQQHRRPVTEHETVGHISPGSLVVQETSCGQPSCRCMADPLQRHGPYYQWSRAIAGKAVSRRLDEHEAAIYREWITTAVASKRVSRRWIRSQQPLGRSGSGTLPPLNDPGAARADS